MLPRAVKADLTVTVRDSPSATPRVWTLKCDPTGGDHPQSAQACAALASAALKGDPFAPTKVGVMCSMIYGGPEVATVTGTFNGKPVNANFGRKDGCQVARWNKVAALLGPLRRPGVVAPTG